MDKSRGFSRPSIVALIPARSGSTRIKNKNIRPLAGHPLVAYTLAAARQSGVFSAIVVSTDSEQYAAIARRYGAEVVLCPTTIAHRSDTPDVLWLRHALSTIYGDPPWPGQFGILRPTSPFRQAVTIRRAAEQWGPMACRYDSLRAVEPVRQHPGKMWRLDRSGLGMTPLLPFDHNGQPWHSNQSAALPTVWVQTAALELAWASNVEDAETGSIAGNRVVSFPMTGYEGVDINTEIDFLFAEFLVERGFVTLPSVEC